MRNAIDVFRAQREVADAVYERLQEIAGLLAQVRHEVDLVTGNADLEAVLQRERKPSARSRKSAPGVSGKLGSSGRVLPGAGCSPCFSRSPRRRARARATRTSFGLTHRNSPDFGRELTWSN
jgi:hypothetical protein